MAISLKYKIEDRHSKTTLNIINSMGKDAAMLLAYNKGVDIVTRCPDSILPIILLAWSFNLLRDSREPGNESLKALASFYRVLAHRVYFFQRKHDLIAVLPDFIQEAL